MGSGSAREGGFTVNGVGGARIRRAVASLHKGWVGRRGGPSEQADRKLRPRNLTVTCRSLSPANVVSLSPI